MRLRAAYWLIDFGLLLVLWFLFVSRLQWSEAWVGLAAAALGAGATEAVRRTEHPRFFPHLSWILLFRRLPVQILSDSWAVTKKLGRMMFRGDRGTGRFITMPFRAGGGGPRAIARRALAIVYGSLSPDSIVVSINRAHNRLVVHLLTGNQVPQILQTLEREQ